ncbi:MAG TPA: hypothetical protein VFE03_09340, partial [Caulobacteraceae bacterium]|nr:hypothetical protein [Caulobacteraceae bacterium]
MAAAAITAGCAHREDPGPSPGRLKALANLARGWSSAAQGRIEASMDPAALALARRLDQGRRPDLWGRAEGWASLDVN